MIKKNTPQERRIILKHADDPKYSNKIGCYLKNNGYSMLKKAFKMKPEEIMKATQFATIECEKNK